VNPTMRRTINYFKAVAWVCSASCILTTQAHSAELSKSDATLILSFMGCNPSRSLRSLMALVPLDCLEAHQVATVRKCSQPASETAKPPPNSTFFYTTMILDGFSMKRMTT
jgi:hypothetical protein